MTTFGLDVENVLNDATSGFLAVYNNKYGTNLKNSHIDRYSLYEKFNLSVQTVHDFLKEAYVKDLVPPMEANLSSTVHRLRKLGKIIIISNNQLSQHHVRQWLVLNDIQFDDIRFGPSWDFDKTDYPDIDIFIDDADYLAVRCEQEKRRMYLYNSPWNQHFVPTRYVVRVNCLDDIIQQELKDE